MDHAGTKMKPGVRDQNMEYRRLGFWNINGADSRGVIAQARGANRGYIAANYALYSISGVESPLGSFYAIRVCKQVRACSCRSTAQCWAVPNCYDQKALPHGLWFPGSRKLFRYHRMYQCHLIMLVPYREDASELEGSIL
jgi:hypothetical protein